MPPIKVLVVDDSMLFRVAVAKCFEEESDIVVIDTANNALDAWNKILNNKPDVITLDVEMPGMTGLEFVSKFMPIVYIPTVIVSSANIAVFDALSAGAVDFVAKPQQLTGSGVFFEELVSKVKVAANAKRSPSAFSRPFVAPVAKNPAKPPVTSFGTASPRADIQLMSRAEVIAIGASTGGTEATSYILKNLPCNLPPILITQHMPPTFTRLYAERLARESGIKVKEAQNGDVIEKGCGYVAPGDAHMRVVRKQGKLVLAVEAGAKVSGHCPSVDVLFDSVATACGSYAVGVILTGMGADGAKGLLAMKRAGAHTIGQDQKSCVVYGMPMEAFKIGAVTKQASLENVAPALVTYFKTNIK